MAEDSVRQRRALPLAQRFKRPIWVAQLAGVVVAAPATSTILLLTTDLSAPARFALGTTTFVALGLGAYLVALGPRTRRALETFVWLGERDVGRFIRETGSHPPASPKDARRWLKTHPETNDTRGHRVDVLLMAGDFEEAGATAERMPTTTASERFFRELQLDHVERALGSDEERVGLRKAAAELESPDDVRAAETYLAWAEASRLAIAGGDWRRPLAAAQERLGRESRRTFLGSRLVRGYALILLFAGGVVVFLQL